MVHSSLSLRATACVILGLAFFAVPSPSTANSTQEYYQSRLDIRNIPDQLSAEDLAKYRDFFTALRTENWQKAQNIAQADNGPLAAVIRAELYLAANSPKVEMGPLLALISDAPDIPQADQLGRLANLRGATQLPALPTRRQLSYRGSISRRGKPRATKGEGAIPQSIADAIMQHIKDDDPAGAYDKLRLMQSSLSQGALTEWRQRIAWSYYIENQDQKALNLALLAANEGSGDWLGEAHWVAGLAAWRLNDCVQAMQSFGEAAHKAGNAELRAAAHYWQSRAYMRCNIPHGVQMALRNAAQYSETLYGLLASESLGLNRPQKQNVADFTNADWQNLKRHHNIRRAVALAQLDQVDLADEMLRHHARLADDEDHPRLLRLARELDLPAAQNWLASYAPPAVRLPRHARFPAPRWQPVDGWRIDPALAYAHIHQESDFRARAVSPAGAVGLMQVRPVSARETARGTDLRSDIEALKQPEINIAHGQRYLEKLRDMHATGGLLPKVIAAYNAGATPVARWNDEINDNDDPLLFIESIPYWETRAYVGIILRNYWMYEEQAGVRESKSAVALSQGLWPKFPVSSHAMSANKDVKGNIGSIYANR